MARRSSRRSRSHAVVGFYTKKKGRHKTVHPITTRKHRSRAKRAISTVLKPLDFFQKKAEEERRKKKERERKKAEVKQKPKPAEPKPKPAPAPKPEPKPMPKGEPVKIRVRRSRGKEGVLPKEMARRILLARMKRFYPDTDYEIIVENMMDDYDPMVTFNENMASLARSERWGAFAKAFEYATDAEMGQFRPSEARDFEREELYRQLDEMIGRIYEEHPLEFQEYLVRRGIAEAA